MLFCIMSDYCEILRVIKNNRYRDLSGSDLDLASHHKRLKHLFAFNKRLRVTSTDGGDNFAWKTSFLDVS